MGWVRGTSREAAAAAKKEHNQANEALLRGSSILGTTHIFSSYYSIIDKSSTDHTEATGSKTKEEIMQRQKI